VKKEAGRGENGGIVRNFINFKNLDFFIFLLDFSSHVTFQFSIVKILLNTMTCSIFLFDFHFYPRWETFFRFFLIFTFSFLFY
jgi:hypothetical protein